ncbi:outer membrane protein assembly factor BamB family protein [Terrimonas pollutisoli]|uniref:outer membrane protein assembly factor BamB family protein n=1 Tax=Terrimonas pollutisoli TaxID=3034147 RepID=UPI0023ECD85F|nr:PQQ-binding-like beta-propeller repeat protein [Terrimonas sp. H1YJ31]
MKKFSLLIVTSFFVVSLFAKQDDALVFVHLSDTHIGSNTGAEDLRRTVKDINENPTIQFVVISGDITEFGSDEEIKLAKQILDSLNKPWHIVPGNHDSNWSESGSNTFKRIFGSETFSFKAGPYLFLGTHSGPNMRMSPGQIPRENIVWLDSILKATDDNTPVIFVNHYPQDSSLNNWFEAIDRLKQKNIQLILCGHGHANRQLNFEAIPTVMGRSNLRAKKEIGGYNIVTIKNNIVSYQERTPGVETKSAWATVEIKNLDFRNSTVSYYRPSYEINKSFPGVKEKWTYQDNSDIGSGTATNGNLVFVTNTNGEVVALNKKNGKPVWRFLTQGKIYAMPAVNDNIVVTASSDNFIYALDAKKGKLIWKVQAEKAVLGNPLIRDGVVYIGASDGHFRAIGLKDGRLHWDFNEVKGFVVTRPLIYNQHIYFGCWNNDFYCLDITSGKLRWKWNNGSSGRMLSPAACFPVATGNRVFIVAPDRYMTSLDANTGNVIWRKQMPDLRVRESMGLSKDSSLVFVKTMDGNVYGISTSANEMSPVWKSDVSLGYEISPTAIVENNNIVFVPTQSGVAVALDRKSGTVLWKHKISNGLITNLLPVTKSQLLVTTMDGKVSLLKF